MFVIWPAIISLTLGLMCGVWLPLFHFIIVAVVEAVGSLVVVWLSSHDTFTTVMDLFAVGIALQFGYVFGIVGSFLVSRQRPGTETPIVKYAPKHDTSIV
jgi:hypothetical protein